MYVFGLYDMTNRFVKEQFISSVQPDADISIFLENKMLLYEYKSYINLLKQKNNDMILKSIE